VTPPREPDDDVGAGGAPGREELPRVVSVPGWPSPRGYADVVRATGTLVVVAGQVGWDVRTQRVVSDDLVDQAAQALRNVVEALRAAGAGPQDLVRLTWFVTDREEYVSGRSRLGEAYRVVLGRHYPAMSVVVVSGLLEPRAKVEIEATAVVAGPGPTPG
jgi:enamine deaminase RidA (YjgF/YER057c/UK114 family)